MNELPQKVFPRAAYEDENWTERLSQFKHRVSATQGENAL